MQREKITTFKGVGRNNPCLIRSGKKFKYCQEGLINDQEFINYVTLRLSMNHYSKSFLQKRFSLMNI